MRPTRIRRFACALLLLGAVAHPAAAQAPAAGSLEQPAQRFEDPFERTSPRDTITGFIRAADHHDFEAASNYLQLDDNQLRNREALARHLKDLIDRHFGQSLTSVSDPPRGALYDALPMDRERVGPMTVGEDEIEIGLVRVTDPQAGSIWLVSSATLARIASLGDGITRSWIERTMPNWALQRELLGISLAHWIVLAAALAVPFISFAVLSRLIAALARRALREPARRRELDAWYAGIRWPLTSSLAIAIQLMSIPSFGFPLTFRIAYARVALVAFVVAVTWLVRRVLTLSFARARGLVRGKDRTSTQSLMLLGERVIKALVVAVSIIAILTIVGVDTKTALAGAGIVGVALALGAQRTVENLLGGFFLLGDRALAVGDLCSISGRLGWVEDITLRSVRLRTLDQSLVSIPAGVLAQSGIENFATRRKVLAQGILRLQYGTSVAQLRRILAGIRKLLDDCPDVEAGTSRVRLVNFGPEAIELELFAYLLTSDVPEFLAMREELLLGIAAVVEAEESGFAPTKLIYMNDLPDADTVPRPAARDAGEAAAVTALPASAGGPALQR